MTRFLLSPANLAGKRAGLLLAGRGDTAARLRSEGLPLGELMSFASGLYFRGKLAYARAFGHALVITSRAGLLPVDEVITLRVLQKLAAGAIDEHDAAYARALRRDARRLDGDVVLLGSIATAKYTGVLLPLLGDRLRFPASFVGRGDMSRGGLMLRAARAGEELDYIPVAGAARHGPRPPRLGAI